jgi:hypothetical protein
VRSARGGQDADEDLAVDVLFVQTAKSVTLDEGKLRMKGVAPATLFFSDRPKRVAGHIPTSVVIDSWGVGGDDSFVADPPNATLSILVGYQPQEIVVVLEKPVYSGDDLTFDVKVLEGVASAKGGACSLFIDDTVIVTNDPVVGPVYGPGSYRGQARRVARRTSRRVARRR